MPRGRRPTKIHLDEVLALMNKGSNQSQVARELGCTPAYIGHLLRKAGHKTSGLLGANTHARANAQKVLDFITTEGGTLRNALLQLNLNVCDATVRALAKERQIDIAEYRYFGQRRRNWTVDKPGFRKREGSKHNYIPVRCCECGHEDELHYLQFQSAHPKVCPNCGAR